MMKKRKTGWATIVLLLASGAFLLFIALDNAIWTDGANNKLEKLRGEFIADFSGILIPRQDTPTRRDFIVRLDELLKNA